MSKGPSGLQKASLQDSLPRRPSKPRRTKGRTGSSSSSASTRFMARPCWRASRRAAIGSRRGSAALSAGAASTPSSRASNRTGVAQPAESPRVMVGPLAARHLFVEQLQPEHPSRQTPDQKPLRERRPAAALRNKLALALGQKPAFTAAAIDPVAQHATPKHAALGRKRSQFPRRVDGIHATIVAQKPRLRKPLLGVACGVL